MLALRIGSGGAFADLDPTTNQLIFSFADTPSIWVDVASLEPAFQGPVSQVLTESWTDRPRAHCLTRPDTTA